MLAYSSQRVVADG